MSYKQGLRALLFASGMFHNDPVTLNTVSSFDKHQNKPRNTDFSNMEQFDDLVYDAVRVHYDPEIPVELKPKYIAVLISETILEICKNSGKDGILIPTLVEIINTFFSETAAEIIREQRISQFGGAEFVNANSATLIALSTSSQNTSTPNLHSKEAMNAYNSLMGIVPPPFLVSMQVEYKQSVQRDHIGAPFMIDKSGARVNAVEFEAYNGNASNELLRIDSLVNYFTMQKINDDQSASYYIDSYIIIIVASVFNKKFKGQFELNAAQKLLSSKLTTQQFLDSLSAKISFTTDLEEIRKEFLIGNDKPFQNLAPCMEKPYFMRMENVGTYAKPSYNPVIDVQKVIYLYWCCAIHKVRLKSDVKAIADAVKIHAGENPFQKILDTVKSFCETPSIRPELLKFGALNVEGGLFSIFGSYFAPFQQSNINEFTNLLQYVEISEHANSLREELQKDSASRRSAEHQHRLTDVLEIITQMSANEKYLPLIGDPDTGDLQLTNLMSSRAVPVSKQALVLVDLQPGALENIAATRRSSLFFTEARRPSLPTDIGVPPSGSSSPKSPVDSNLVDEGGFLSIQRRPIHPGTLAPADSKAYTTSNVDDDNDDDDMDENGNVAAPTSKATTTNHDHADANDTLNQVKQDSLQVVSMQKNGASSATTTSKAQPKTMDVAADDDDDSDESDEQEFGAIFDLMNRLNPLKATATTSVTQHDGNDESDEESIAPPPELVPPAPQQDLRQTTVIENDQITETSNTNPTLDNVSQSTTDVSENKQMAPSM